MAVFLVTAKQGPAPFTVPACTTPPFNDVPIGSGFCKWIKAAKDQGIMLGGSIEGCTPGNFCPGSPVTRDHMAAFLLRAKDGGSYLPQPCTDPTMFLDVPASHPYCRWIEEIARRGITGGCGGGNYCPTDANTRAQMAVFVSVNWNLQ
jgi:endo-1,4-beta-xylanase